METCPLDSLFGSEQLALFSPPDLSKPVTGADKCALHFASTFRRQYQEQGSPERISEELETLCLACLLVLSECAVRPNTRLLHELVMCRDSLQTMQPWRMYDALPFEICLSLLGQTNNGMVFFHRNLTNHDSGVRSWMFDLGWFIRQHLNPEATGNIEVMFGLLKNVEDTLGCWDKSLALCRSLYPDRETFWAAVVSYEAKAMPEQFAERIEWAKKNIWEIEWHSGLLAREVQVRRLMDTYLLGSTL